MLRFAATMLLGVMAMTTGNVIAQEQGERAATPATPPPAPVDVRVHDAPLDGGEKLIVEWRADANAAPATKSFKVSWTYNDQSLQELITKASKNIAELEQKFRGHPDRETLRKLLRDACTNRAKLTKNESQPAGTVAFKNDQSDYSLTIDNLHHGVGYNVQVQAVGENGETSSVASAAQPVAPRVQYFDGDRFNVVIIVMIVCGSIIAFILIARSGVPLKIRKIAGLEAVDEAVGRATEMGRPVLFVPGIQDMNDMMTLAGLTALGHVAKKAAEYDAKLEVPTSKSLVMTAARETVHSAFLAAGRPDAYNQDLIYYVTDEQFGYVAYLSGHMARQKPAACFYLGAFFAESLILAETGNSVGAIQIAGTAETAQLPFFVAACDYTLIGEEFYAASAYLSGEPNQLGSLRGQDIGKAIVAAGLAIGCIIATFAALFPNSAAVAWLEFLKNEVLR